MLHRVLKRAGLPKVRFHDLRHTFATLALQNGVDIKTVSGMLGHFGRVHAGHLRPRHDSSPEGGGQDHGKSPDGGNLKPQNHSQKQERPGGGNAASGPFFDPVWVTVWVNCKFCKIA
ncbi:tyrosine-type recombinase/integrase [Dysosmobacter welbionis]|uniref:tyrosine-type recombinase/integrase n=1 Tax=Dysosmobacter welbionis TaxID=2093857 RepID=UPI00300F75EA